MSDIFFVRSNFEAAFKSHADLRKPEDEFSEKKPALKPFNVFVSGWSAN